MNKLKKGNTGPKSKGRKSSGGQNSSGASSSEKANSGNVDNTSPSTSNKDKANAQKPKPGIDIETIKCIWDQHEMGDIEINPEILNDIAEDVNYRLWELVNNLKTFTRHSGGKLTTDIVNEVLKDCNVPPVIGARAANTDWNELDCGGTFYYHADEQVDTREDYQKDISSIQPGPLSLYSTWIPQDRDSEDMEKFSDSLLLAITMGDEITFHYSLQTTVITPFIGCLLPTLIPSIVGYLTFECPEDTLDRMIKFLQAIASRKQARDITLRDDLFNLSNVLVSTLFGPIDIKTELEIIKYERQQFIKDEAARLVREQEEERERLANRTRDERLINIKVEADPTDEIKYTFSQMGVNPFALGIKQEVSNDSEYEHTVVKTEHDVYDMEFSDRHEYDDSYFKCKKEEITYSEDANLDTLPMDSSPTQYMDENADEQPDDEVPDVFSGYHGELCVNEEIADEMCTVIGSLASLWGYFEHEVIYLLTKRLEIFFYSVNEWSHGEFKLLQRFVQVLSALGNSAFRELTIYFDQIPHDELPEWILPHFNYAAIYIRGQKDFYFYEYMSEVCGDGLNPFTVYYSKFVTKEANIRLAIAKKNEGNVFRIPTRLILQTAPREDMSGREPTIDLLFPNRSIPKQRRIGFRFAGCSPVPIKQKRRPVTQPMIQSEEEVEQFNSKIVICRRKLLKQLVINDLNDASKFVDFRLMNI